MEKEKAILLKINGELKDIGAPTAPGDQRARRFIPAAPEALDVYRHSCAHLLAQAVIELFPGVQYGVGPAVENGFYYDFLIAAALQRRATWSRSPSKMAHLVKQNLPIHKEIWTKEQAADYFRSQPAALEAGAARGKSRAAMRSRSTSRAISSTCAAARTCPPPDC